MAKLTKEEKKELKGKYVRYGWQILEAKFCYYEGPKHNIKPMLTDHDYDLLEKKYVKVARKLKMPTTASDNVGYPSYEMNVGARGMVAQHMIATKGRKGSKVKEIIKEINIALKTVKKILNEELSEKKAEKIYHKIRKELNPNK